MYYVTEKIIDDLTINFMTAQYLTSKLKLGL